MSIAFLSPKWSNLTIQMMIHHVLGIKKKKLFTLSLGTKFWDLLWNNELSFSLINKCNLCLRVLGGLEVREVQILVDLKEHNHNGQINDAISCHGPLNATQLKDINLSTDGFITMMQKEKESIIPGKKESHSPGSPFCPAGPGMPSCPGCPFSPRGPGEPGRPNSPKEEKNCHQWFLLMF